MPRCTSDHVLPRRVRVRAPPKVVLWYILRLLMARNIGRYEATLHCEDLFLAWCPTAERCSYICTQRFLWLNIVTALRRSNDIVGSVPSSLEACVGLVSFGAPGSYHAVPASMESHLSSPPIRGYRGIFELGYNNQTTFSAWLDILRGTYGL